MYMDDDTHRLDPAVFNFWVPKLWVDRVVFNFWDPKTRSFVIRGSSLVDEGLDPSCSKPRKCSIQQQLLYEFTLKSAITAQNKLLLALKDRLQLHKVFIYPKLQISSSN